MLWPLEELAFGMIDLCRNWPLEGLSFGGIGLWRNWLLEGLAFGTIGNWNRQCDVELCSLILKSSTKWWHPLKSIFQLCVWLNYGYLKKKKIETLVGFLFPLIYVLSPSIYWQTHYCVHRHHVKHSFHT
jgi:hypothetical protein